MEPDGSLQCPQELSIGPYPEPDPSSPYHPILSLAHINNIYKFDFFIMKPHSHLLERSICWLMTFKGENFLFVLNKTHKYTM